MKRILVVLLVSLLSITAFASSNELAANVVKIGYAKATAAEQGDNSHVYMHFTNNGELGHTVIAAFSPVATQIQLHTFVMVSGKPIEVMIHSLPLQAGKYLYLSKLHENIALMGLKKALTVGEMIPVTVLYRDGSYETVDATVVK